MAVRAPQDLVDRLRAALDRQRQARAELDAARREEAALLAELRRLGVGWSGLARRFDGQGDRNRISARLRRRAWRLGVVPLRHRKALQRPAGAENMSETSVQEVTAMHDPRIVRRHVIEEFERAADAVGDLDDADLDGPDEDLGDATPPSPEPKHEPSGGRGR